MTRFTERWKLQRGRQRLINACIIEAIKIIRSERATDAIPTLLKYLDFNAHPPVIYDPLTQGPTAEIYPAVDALARFGAPAVPALRSAVGNEDLSRVGRQNAALALLQRYDDEPRQIRFVMKSARNTQDRDVADGLIKLAKQFASLCKPEEKEACREAATLQ